MNRALIATIAATAALIAPAAASAQTPPSFQQTVQQRTAALDAQIKSLSATIKGRNTQIAQLNQQLNALRANPVANAAQIRQIQAQIDSLTNAQQLDMIKLQGLMKQWTQAQEALTNMMSKMANSTSTIISNLRP